MAYTIGSVTLPRPKQLTRTFVETQKSNITFNGILKRKLTNRKEQYKLEYRELTQAQYNNILSEYNLRTVRTFTVSDGSLSIGPTDVHVEVGTEEHTKGGGKNYRHTLILILKEVT